MSKPIAAVFVVTFAALTLWASGAPAVTISTVPVGYVGNPADPATGLGTVNYAYSIGTYDVTMAQYAAFLNAVAATDTYGLYNSHMANGALEGISQSGSSGSFTYAVIGSSANDPINYETWGDAARFANWLSNSQPNGGEGIGTTETGSYSMNGATTDAQLNNVVRSSTATWVIPDENEWYKAAYYQPTAQGGPASSYWDYATRSNILPTSEAPPGGIDSANVFGVNGFAVTGSKTFNPSQNYLTVAGAYTGSGSFFGTFDQAGDLYNWTETLVTNAVGMSRSVQGDSWAETLKSLPASSQNYDGPSKQTFDYGFRLALVPEPSAQLLAIVAFGLLCWWRKRFV